MILLSMKKEALIYGLRAGAFGFTRYVGATTKTLEERLRRHLGEAKNGATHHRACWIRSVLAREIDVEIFWIDSIDILEEWRAVEAAYIQFYKEEGVSLVNGTPGGDGFGAGAEHPHFGKIFSSTHRAKMSLARAGKKLSLEHCARMSECRRGKKRPQNMGEKISIALLGKKQSSETCEKKKLAQQIRRQRERGAE